MTILVTRAEQSYAPQTVSIPFTVATAQAYMVVTITRVAWPAGDVARASFVWADGSRGSALFRGDGATAVRIGTEKRAGITGGTVTVEVTQGCTSAITVESL
jgi:hypothetical protein